MQDEKLCGLSEVHSNLVKRVEREVGEIAAASLELVLRKSKVNRFQGINETQFRKICDIADEEQIALPTRQF